MDAIWSFIDITYNTSPMSLCNLIMRYAISIVHVTIYCIHSIDYSGELMQNFNFYVYTACAFASVDITVLRCCTGCCMCLAVKVMKEY